MFTEVLKKKSRNIEFGLITFNFGYEDITMKMYLEAPTGAVKK